MYTLVSASVLAMDVARHPEGRALARLLDRALTARAGDLTSLGRTALALPDREDSRAAAREAATAQPRLPVLVAGVGRALASGPPGPEVSRVLSEALGDTPMGSLSALEDLVRRDLLVPALAEAGDEGLLAEYGAQALLDALAAHWLAPVLPAADRDRLAAPWQRWDATVPVVLSVPPYGPCSAAVGRVLDDLRGRDDAGWLALEQAYWSAAGGRPTAWSLAMHAACAAAWTTGRLHEAARAQLAVAGVVAARGLPSGFLAGGVLMAVAAAVQGAVVADVLDDATSEALMGPWTAAAA